MIYIVDNISNYLIYLFIIYFGFRLSPRKSKLFLGTSVLIMLFAGAFNAYFDSNFPAPKQKSLKFTNIGLYGTII
ncbi:MAG: hypothetical protein HDQ95_00990 [Roseburia sp.]|nr:hypothetical protein [Roseburia sp.]